MIEPGVERSQLLIGRIWSDVLGAGRVPVDADLLDLGGDSLTAEWIAARVRTAFPGSTLTGRDVLVRTPTVAALATLVGPVRAPLALSSQQEALLGRIEVARRDGLPMRAFNVGAAVGLRGPLDVAALRAALERLVHRQAALRCSYHRDQDWHAELNPARPVALPVIDVARDEVTRRLAEATNTAFAAGEPVRLRAQLLRVAAEEHVLGLVMDHIVGDGFSLGVLYAELGRAYAALTGAGPPVNQEPTHAFFDFVAAQRNAGRDPALAFWRDNLGEDGILAHVPLPFERDVPADAARVARTTGVRLAPDLLSRLDDSARRARSTRFRFVLTALNIVLHRASGMDRLTILCPDANRDASDVHGVIGWFSHLVPYRADLSGDPTLAEALDRVRRTVQDAQAHKHLTYHDLIHALRPDKFGVIRDATWVNLVTVEPDTMELPGLRCRPIPIPADAPYRALEVELEGTRLRVNFDGNRFDEAAVAGLLDELVRTLRLLTEDRSRRVSELP